jgi:hypothetical protein
VTAAVLLGAAIAGFVIPRGKGSQTAPSAAITPDTSATATSAPSPVVDAGDLAASSASASPAYSVVPAPRRRALPASDCNPPFVRDREGRKIYKRECLR